MIEGLALLTIGGLLSVVHPVRRHLAWVRYRAESDYAQALRSAFPVVETPTALDALARRAEAAIGCRT